MLGSAGLELPRRTSNGAIGAEHAAVPRTWVQELVAPCALVRVNARVLGH